MQVPEDAFGEAQAAVTTMLQEGKDQGACAALAAASVKEVTDTVKSQQQVGEPPTSCDGSTHSTTTTITLPRTTSRPHGPMTTTATTEDHDRARRIVSLELHGHDVRDLSGCHSAVDRLWV